MPLGLTASDYLMFDGQAETSTYTQVLPDGNNTAIIPNAVFMGAIRREIQTDGGFLYQYEQEIWIPKAEMIAVSPPAAPDTKIVPAEGDFVTDAAGKNWYLMADIEHSTEGIAGTGEMYRVVTRKQRS